MDGFTKGMTKQQIEYFTLKQEGYTHQQIADIYGVDKSTVSRTIKRALRNQCPFSPDCRRCPLPDCAIKEPYAHLLNNTENELSIDKRRTKRWV